MFCPPEILLPDESVKHLVQSFVYQKSQVSQEPFITPSFGITTCIITTQGIVQVFDPSNNHKQLVPKITLAGLSISPQIATYLEENIEFLGADLCHDALYNLTGKNISSYINMHLDATDILNTGALFTEIQNLKTIEEKKSCFEEFFAAKFNAERYEECEAFRKSIEIVHSTEFQITLPELYDELAMSKVTFMRKYKKVTCVPP